MSELKRIVCIGRNARMNRAVVDLDYPTPRQQRTFVIICEDHDIDLLRGYRPPELRYIPMNPSLLQLTFLAERGHTEISIAEARAWLKSIEPGHR